jgi:hypothetical protein
MLAARGEGGVAGREQVMAKMLGVDVVDNTPDCPYTHTLMERQQVCNVFL